MSGIGSTSPPDAATTPPAGRPAKGAPDRYHHPQPTSPGPLPAILSLPGRTDRYAIATESKQHEHNQAADRPHRARAPVAGAQRDHLGHVAPDLEAPAGGRADSDPRRADAAGAGGDHD